MADFCTSIPITSPMEHASAGPHATGTRNSYLGRRLTLLHASCIYMRGANSSMDKDRGGSLRSVEFHILISLAAGERHGYGIIQDIEERGETAVPDVGTMYRALARMVEHRLIEPAERRPA